MAEQPKKKVVPQKRAREESKGEDIFQAPVIVREPSSRQAKLGSNVVIRVQATGKPLPSYQWFHNGKKIVGANTDRLTINKVRRLNAGAYHCEAKNLAGKATSRACMLSFIAQRVPKLVIGPELSRIEEGQGFVLKLISPSIHEIKDFKIYWCFNGMRIKGASGPELVIGSAKKKYEGEYKAMISVGSGIETSNVARLTITPSQGRTSRALDAQNSPPLRESGTAMKEEAFLLSNKTPKAASNWEDFLFNPEEEEENISGEEDLHENPNEGRSPLSQMGTGKLIKELAAMDAKESPMMDNLFAPQRHEEVDVLSLLNPTSTPEAIDFPEREDASSLIEALEARRDSPRKLPLAFPEKKTPQRDNRPVTAGSAPPHSPPTKEKPSLQFGSGKFRPASSSPENAASFELARKKEFLEKFLNHLQHKNTRGTRKRAA